MTRRGVLGMHSRETVFVAARFFFSSLRFFFLCFVFVLVLLVGVSLLCFASSSLVEDGASVGFVAVSVGDAELVEGWVGVAAVGEGVEVVDGGAGSVGAGELVVDGLAAAAAGFVGVGCLGESLFAEFLPGPRLAWGGLAAAGHVWWRLWGGRPQRAQWAA